MTGRFPFLFSFFLCVSTILVHCEHGGTHEVKEKLETKTAHLHFYVHQVSFGKNKTAVRVAYHPEKDGSKSELPIPFGTVIVCDDPATVGLDPGSEQIGNAQGMYVSTYREKLGLMLYIDVGFTTGEYTGSTVSFLSRTAERNGSFSVAVIGGTGQFRLAKGFAKVIPHELNFTNGTASIEYDVTLLLNN